MLITIFYDPGLRKTAFTITFIHVLVSLHWDKGSLEMPSGSCFREELGEGSRGLAALWARATEMSVGGLTQNMGRGASRISDSITAVGPSLRVTPGQEGWCREVQKVCPNASCSEWPRREIHLAQIPGSHLRDADLSGLPRSPSV